MKNTSSKKPHPFGCVLRSFREQKGWTQYRLAKEAGKSLSQVFQLEAGRGEPRLSTMVIMADALDIPPEDLFATTLVEMRKGLLPKKRKRRTRTTT